MNTRLDDLESLAEQANFPVDLLAKDYGITDRPLRRHFRQKFGSPPHVWMTRHRLQKVEPLLSAAYLVKEAAAKAGFSQQANFTRRFKRYNNTTPSSFRL